MSAAGLGDSPHPPPKANLGGAFGRAGGLAGLDLGRPPVPPASSRKSTPSQDGDQAPNPGPVEVTEPTADPVASPRERRQTRRRPAAPRNPASLRRRVVIVYLPLSLKDRLDQHRAVTGQAITRVTLEAITATHKGLSELLQEPESDPERDELFVYDAPRPQREPKIQVTLRLREDQLAVIDDLVGQYGAPDRSALVAAALRGHLP
jgi:hypothetical protein